MFLGLSQIKVKCSALQTSGQQNFYNLIILRIAAEKIIREIKTTRCPCTWQRPASTILLTPKHIRFYSPNKKAIHLRTACIVLHHCYLCYFLHHIGQLNIKCAGSACCKGNYLVHGYIARAGNCESIAAFGNTADAVMPFCIGSGGIFLIS